MERIKKNIMKFFKRWNEFLPFLLALPIWWLSGFVTRMIDPTAGTDDLGLFQALVFGLVIYFAACAFSWFALRTIFPIIGKYVDDQLGEEFKESGSSGHWNRLWFSFAMFALYFIGAIIILTNTI
ncbi:MAG: hypothetical protein QM500_08535 [Methylococcales bacterium]